MWQGSRVLDAAWIEEPTAGHGRPALLDRNGYPSRYFWGRHTYRIGERDVETIEAHGNGGQYLFIAPELDLVAVVNSGNYRGGLEMTRQPELIFGSHILPAALGH